MAVGGAGIPGRLVRAAAEERNALAHGLATTPSLLMEERTVELRCSGRRKCAMDSHVLSKVGNF